MTSSIDERVAKGIYCTYWDTVTPEFVEKHKRTSVAAQCPYCSGKLSTNHTKRTFLEFINDVGERLERAGFAIGDRYVEIIRWGRGKCFPGFTELRLAFEESRKAGEAYDHIPRPSDLPPLPLDSSTTTSSRVSHPGTFQQIPKKDTLQMKRENVIARTLHKIDNPGQEWLNLSKSERQLHINNARRILAELEQLEKSTSFRTK